MKRLLVLILGLIMLIPTAALVAFAAPVQGSITDRAAIGQFYAEWNADAWSPVITEAYVEEYERLEGLGIDPGSPEDKVSYWEIGFMQGYVSADAAYKPWGDGRPTILMFYNALNDEVYSLYDDPLETWNTGVNKDSLLMPMSHQYSIDGIVYQNFAGGYTKGKEFVLGKRIKDIETATVAEEVVLTKGQAYASTYSGDIWNNLGGKQIRDVVKAVSDAVLALEAQGFDVGTPVKDGVKAWATGQACGTLVLADMINTDSNTYIWSEADGRDAMILYNAATGKAHIVYDEMVTKYIEFKLTAPTGDLFELNGVKYQNFTNGYIKVEVVNEIATPVIVFNKNVDAQGNEIHLSHLFSETWTVVAEANCTEKGEEKRVCSICGFEEKREISALGHEYGEEWAVDKEATCTEDGSKSHHCIRCDDKADVTIVPSLGHEYGEEWTVDKAATCTEDGSKSHHCTRCDDKADVTVIPAAHLYGEWDTIEGTCTTPGQKKHTCTVCGYEETQNFEVLGHDWATEWTVDKEATCTEDGSKSHHCTRCEEKNDITVIPAAHEYGEWTLDKAATCTEKGSEQHVCTVCDHVEKRETAVLGHDWATEWTVDKEATCTEDGSKSHHCTRCEEKNDITAIPAAHEYETEWTTDKAATCAEAGSKSHHCANCDAKTDVTEIPVAEHAYGVWAIETAATCTEKGTEKRVCTECEHAETREIAVLGHDWETAWKIDKAVSCTEAGSKSHHCARCDDKKDVTEIPVLDHTEGKWVVDKEAAPGEAGHKHKDCTVCGTQLAEEDIPALPTEGEEKQGCASAIEGGFIGLAAALTAVVAMVLLMKARKANRD